MASPTQWQASKSEPAAFPLLAGVARDVIFLLIVSTKMTSLATPARSRASGLTPTPAFVFINPMSNLDRLRQRLDTLSPQTEDEWLRFIPIVEPVVYQKNDLLIQAGQVETYIYYVAEGMVRLFLNDDGKDISLDFGFSHDFISAYSSFLTGQPTAFTVQALTHVQALRFSRTNLLTLYEQSHKAERIGRLIAEQAFLRKTSREVQFLTLTAKQRYIQLLEQNPILVQTIPVRHLASYLGIEPESLSRIRRDV